MHRCPECGEPTLKLTSDVDGSIEHLCSIHGSVRCEECHGAGTILTYADEHASTDELTTLPCSHCEAWIA